jgi:hypothetical protein
MRLRAILSASLVLAVLAFPAVASATVKQYVLRHPKREHCKAHYVRTVKHAKVHGKRVQQVWCVYTPPKPVLAPTETSVSASGVSSTPPGPAEEPAHFTVSGGISAGNMALVGLPIIYTITDATTGQTVGSFTGLSNSYASCAVVLHENEQGTTVTYIGEAVTPYAGCALAPVSMPAADTPLFAGSFAGNSTYAPSVSKQVLF